jgi:hypothetical protein
LRKIIKISAMFTRGKSGKNLKSGSVMVPSSAIGETVSESALIYPALIFRILFMAIWAKVWAEALVKRVM